MTRCAQCSQDIPHGAGACPHCGAELPSGADTLEEAATLSVGPSHPNDLHESRPDYQLSRRAPLGGARFAPGHIFAGRYRIVSLLGRGGMGEVYRADDLRIGRPIALKLLAVPAVREEQLQRFVAEVRLARDIAHPNVCRVYDIGHADGWHYLSMEYVDGESLASLLRRVGRMPGEKAADIARQLSVGLAAAHEAGVLHRDIKPSNIMLDGRGRVRLMDFGLAVPADNALTGELAGTPAYMAPEQFAGDSATERSDLYALGLVLYELFTGRQMFPARSFDDRRQLGFDAPADVSLAQLDPAIGSTIRACLMRDPSARPASARALTKLLPGGDPLAAAVAEGRLLSPEMVAAAEERGELRPVHAWMLCAVVVAGVLLIAGQIGDVTQLRPAVLPKSPDALTERAGDILKIAGHTALRRDSEHWFVAELESSQSPPAVNARLRRIRFAFRQSPAYLLPLNIFRLVTADDPAPTLPGMASVNLDADGRLIELIIVPTNTVGPAPAPADWSALFAAAGLPVGEFLARGPEDPPAVPHDQHFAWRSKSSSSAPVHVSAASFRGHAVYFGVTAGAASPLFGERSPHSPGTPPVVQARLWLGIIVAFTAAAAMARHNYRRGEGDRRGARRWSMFIIVAGTASAILQGHHVPNVIQEASFLFAVTGWAVVWSALSWLLYMSLEPHVRRLWPGTLISWTRLLSGRIRDPMIGRDVLLGLTVGIVLVSARLAISEPAPHELLIQQLDGLRSTRAFTHGLLFHTMNAVQYQLGGLFFLLLIRVIVRRTWIAAIIVPLLFLPVITAGTTFQSPAVASYALVVGIISVAMVLRVGFVAASAALLSQFLLMRLPLTLDTSTWYFGYSIVVMLIVISMAAVAAIVASGVATPSPARMT